MSKYNNIVFTRYLYIEDEVKHALLISLLNKNDDAIFWAYELFYSGISKSSFFKLIWNIYYDFYAVLNPSFESYLLKKQKETIQNNTKLISTIIQNLLIRPFNTDVFLNYNINKIYELDSTYNLKSDEELEKYFENCITNKDYKSISNYILNCETQALSNNIYSIIIKILDKSGYKLNLNKLLLNYSKLDKIKVSKKKILLAKVLSLFTSNKGKNFYVVVSDEDIIPYETLRDTISYKLLKKVCICGINDLGFIDLFHLKRETQTYSELLDNFHKNWLYYSSFMSVWKKRIIRYGGKIDHDNKTIIFEDEELEELFRNKYDYEPDEQCLKVKNKIIPDVYKNNSKWIDFYNEYSKNNLFQIDTYILSIMDEETIKF
jgi:hypothetical protein